MKNCGGKKKKQLDSCMKNSVEEKGEVTVEYAEITMENAEKICGGKKEQKHGFVPEANCDSEELQLI